MYRPPQLTPLVSGQIGGVAAAFTGTSQALLAGLAALRTETLLQNMAYFGAGRFVASSAEASGAAPIGAPSDGGGLSVSVPLAGVGGAKAVWMVGGVAFTLDELANYAGGVVLLDNVPPAGTWYGYLSLSFDEDDGYSLGATWLANADGTKRRSGSPCIGKVTTGADSVTSIDHSVADLIWSMSYVQARVVALAASGSGSGSGGGTGGSGGAAFATLLPISEEDATSTKQYIDDIASELQSALDKASGAAELFPAPFDNLANEVALNRVGLAEVNPHSIERGEISVIVAQAGYGQDDTPNFSPDTGDELELPWDATRKVFGT